MKKWIVISILLACGIAYGTYMDKIDNLTTDGFVRVGSSNGTLSSSPIVDGDVPDTITIDLAATATALAADPANCSAGNAPLGILASGAVEGCFDVWTEAENTAAGYISSVSGGDHSTLSNLDYDSAGHTNFLDDRGDTSTGAIVMDLDGTALTFGDDQDATMGWNNGGSYMETNTDWYFNDNNVAVGTTTPASNIKFFVYNEPTSGATQAITANNIGTGGATGLVGLNNNARLNNGTANVKIQAMIFSSRTQDHAFGANTKDIIAADATQYFQKADDGWDTTYSNVYGFFHKLNIPTIYGDSLGGYVAGGTGSGDSTIDITNHFPFYSQGQVGDGDNIYDDGKLIITNWHHFRADSSDTTPYAGGGGYDPGFVEIGTQAGMWIENMKGDNVATGYGIVLDGDGAGSDIVFGVAQDVDINFDSEDLIIDSNDITANDEVHFTEFDKITLNSDDVQIEGYGSLYYDGGIEGTDNSSTLTIGSNDTMIQIVASSVTDDANYNCGITSNVSCDNTTDMDLTVDDANAAGPYEVTWELSVTGTNGSNHKCAIYANNAVVTESVQERNLGSAGVGYFGGKGFVVLSSGHTVDLRCEDTNVPAQNMVIHHMGLHISKIGH